MARRRAARPGRRRLTTVEAASPDRLPVDRAAISDDLEAARVRLHALLGQADQADLRRRTNGTAWTNEQLLFHMVFGFLVVRVLVRLVRVVGRLPAPVGRGWAGLLDSARRPFHAVKHWGARGGALVVDHDRMGRVCDRTIAALQRSLAREREADLDRGMAYPTSWDPFFQAYMTLADIYRYPTLHFEHHRAQLTLRAHPGAPGEPGESGASRT